MGPVDIIVLYMAFRIKQLVCDFFLQTSWIAQTKDRPFKEGGAKALLLHAGIHACGTFLIVLSCAEKLWWLGFVDFVVHFSVDKIKSLVTRKNGWSYKDSAYWWVFGLDQEAHNLTHLVYIILIIRSAGIVFH